MLEEAVVPSAVTSTSAAPTTTIPLASTAAPVEDPSADNVQLVIYGLIGLSVLLVGFTIWFWRATTPPPLDQEHRFIPAAEILREPPTPTGATVDAPTQAVAMPEVAAQTKGSDATAASPTPPPAAQQAFDASQPGVSHETSQLFEALSEIPDLNSEQ